MLGLLAPRFEHAEQQVGRAPSINGGDRFDTQLGPRVTQVFQHHGRFKRHGRPHCHQKLRSDGATLPRASGWSS